MSEQGPRPPGTTESSRADAPPTPQSPPTDATPPPTSTPPSSGAPPTGRDGGFPVGRLVAGIALILVGGLWLIDATGVADLRWQVVLPALLTVVGAALLATARREEHGGLIAAGIVLGVLTLATATPMAGLADGFGERAERPVDVTAAEEGYELGVGALRLDLSEVDGLVDGTTVPVSVGVGEVVVRLPEGVGARVEGSVGIGEVVVLGRSQGGMGVSVTEEVDGEPMVVLELSAGIGRVEVVR